MTWLFNVGKEYSCQRTLLILGGKDESGVRSCHSCSTHGYFIVHLQVFGIISGVVMVIILYSRTSQTPPYCEIESVRPRGGASLMRLFFFEEENDRNALKGWFAPHICAVWMTGSALGNISISLYLLHPSRGTHCSFLQRVAQYPGKGEPLLLSLGQSRANLIKCVQQQTTAGKLNVEVKTICANFPL